MRFTPRRAFTFSSGWNFAIVNRGRTNNHGFVHDQDYDSSSHSPLLAVVGDSYVQALMVPFPATLQGRLAACVGERGRVYSFAAAGAPLSQYLAEAELARTDFHPDALVVVVVGNDFDESLLRYKSEPGFHYFQDGEQGLTLTRLDYAPSGMRRLIRHSAFARYLFYNLNIVSALTNLRQRSAENAPGRFVGNTPADTGSQRLADSRQAVDEFFTQLPARAGLAPARIVLVVDGLRPELYGGDSTPTGQGSYFERMRGYFLETGSRRGFQMIDMQPRFIARHRGDGARFEFPHDGHWNANGHEEAAAAVAGWSVFGQLFGSTGCVR